jgi:hypothetical protein
VNSKISIAVLLFVIVIATGMARATCTNATLNGVYGFISVGLNGSGVPASNVTQVKADGNGNLTGTTTKSIDGTIVTFATTGTYHLLTNCTGSATLTNQDGQTEHDNLVLNNGNKGGFLIQTDPNHVESAIAAAQGLATCTDLGVKHTYSLEATGIRIGIGQIAAVGQLALNGAGSLKGTLSISANGSIASSLPVTGTYQINANCTGTATFTPQGQSAINIGIVIVNAGKELMFLETDSNTVVAGTLQQ